MYGTHEGCDNCMNGGPTVWVIPVENGVKLCAGCGRMFPESFTGPPAYDAAHDATAPNSM